MGLFSRYQKPVGFLGLAAVVLLGACSRTEVIPDTDMPGMDTTAPVYTTPYPVSGGPAPAAGTHTVQAGDTLYGIARRYGLNFRDIAAQNAIPPPYTIRPGQQLRLYGGVSATPVPAVSAPTGQATYYTVKRGDTLYNVARQYGVDYRALAAQNNIPPPYTIYTGQTLVVGQSYSTVPTPMPVAAAPAPVVVSRPPASGGRVVEFVDFSQGSEPVVVPSPVGYTPAQISTLSLAGAVFHRVQAGDTLYGIAQQHNQHFQNIAAWNGLQPPYALNAGQHLLVVPPKQGAAYIPIATAGGGGYYSVQAGDTLYSIARRYGRSVQELAQWNGLAPPYVVILGQRLQVTPVVSMDGMGGMSGMGGTVKFQPGTKTLSAYPMSATAQPVAQRIMHTVQAGETLESIAQRYNQSAQQLALWNGISPPYVIYPGQPLQIILP